MANQYTIEELENLSPNELGSLLLRELLNESTNIKFIKNLIIHGADLHRLDYDNGLSALHYAILNFRIYSDVARLLLKHGANIDIRGYDGKTPLHYACDPNMYESRMGDDGGYAFINLNAIKFLIESGANLNADDGYGITPLKTIIAGGSSTAAIKMLINGGVDLDYEDPEISGYIRMLL